MVFSEHQILLVCRDFDINNYMNRIHIPDIHFLVVHLNRITIPNISAVYNYLAKSYSAHIRRLHIACTSSAEIAS